MGLLTPSSLTSLSWTTWAILCTALLAVHICQLTIRRLYLSPIAHIPGPRLAALTWAYEFYYDVILGGQYTFKILDLHKQYGPVIRINPFEVHALSNRAFYHNLYAGAPHRREKSQFYAHQFGADHSAFSTVSHDLHKLRRAALNPFFSVTNVARLQGVIEEQVDNVLRRLAGHAASASSSTTPKPLDLVFVFAAFTNDVINEYAFARSEHLVDRPDFGRATTASVIKGTEMGMLAKHMPWALPVITALPDTLTERYVSGWDEFNHLRRTIRSRIKEIQQSIHSDKWSLDMSHKTIFHELLTSSALPPQEKAVERLAHEGQILCQAGTLTTSNALCVAAFHLLDQPDCLRRLRDELHAAFPEVEDVMSISDLQQLPYLSAVAKEAMRLGFGGTGTRLSRVAPDETLSYIEKTEHGDKVWMIPPGTPVGMTSYQILTDEAVYPEPFSFRPQRWLQAGADPQELYSVVFTAGSRSCVGRNLARAELYLMLAKLFLRWGGGGHVGHNSETGDAKRRGDVGMMRLFQTTARDTHMAADRFMPGAHKDSKGIRVIVENYTD